MRLLQTSPNLSQRELAEQMGISLGWLNYFLKAEIEVLKLEAGNNSDRVQVGQPVVH